MRSVVVVAGAVDDTAAEVAGAVDEERGRASGLEELEVRRD